MAGKKNNVVVAAIAGLTTNQAAELQKQIVLMTPKNISLKMMYVLSTFRREEN